MALEVAQVVMDANTVTTITNNINSLYSNAISQLTAYTFGIVALVGVLVPVIVTIIQSRSLKAEKENLEKYISDEVTKIKAAVREELLDELKLKIESESKLLSASIEDKFKLFNNKLECAKAASFHIQGNTNLSKNLHPQAANDFCAATDGFLKGEDELNGKRTLNSLIIYCLPKINKEEYEDYDLDKSINELEALLKKVNQNSRHSDAIRDLNSERKAAKKREPETI